MKLDSRKLILAGVSAAILIAAVASLTCTSWLSGSFSGSARAGRAVSGSPALASKTVVCWAHNPADAFKGQGCLALVYQKLLFVFDGYTDVTTQITDSGQVSQPAWSHDGEWLAYLYGTGSQMAPVTWLARRDGTQAHQVKQVASDGGFSWLPTDDVLAVGGQSGIWLVPAEGKPRQLSNAAASAPVWSPDGKTLAYSVTLPYDSNHPEDRSDALYTIGIDGSQPVQRLVTPQSGIELAGWWPDGKGLLYWVDPVHSASLAADGMPLNSLQLGSTQPKTLAFGLDRPGWLSLAPRNNILMVKGGGRIVWAGQSLTVINVSSGDVRDLKNPPGCVAIDPSLSKDGSRIAFVAAKDLGAKTWGFDNNQDLMAWVASRTLWVEQVNGSGAHPLTSAGRGIYQPCWSRDGSHILYVRDNCLWLIGADGGEPGEICGQIAADDPTGGAFGYYGFISYGSKMAWFQP